jgi:hypothetical protein
MTEEVAPPITEVSTAPVAVEPAVSAVIPVPAETAPASNEPTHPSETPTLLEKFPAKEAKPEESKPPAEVKPPAETKPPTETKTEEKLGEAAKEPLAQPFEYKYTLPENLKMDDTLRGEVHAALDAFRTNPAEGVQGLIDFYHKQTQAFAENYSKESLKNQITVFNKTRADWVKEVMADPELGGAGHDTAMGVVARMRDRYVSSHKPGTPEYARDMSDFNTMLRMTGAGEHKALLRLLKNVGRDFDEPEAPLFTPSPPPDLGKRPPARLRDIYKA